MASVKETIIQEYLKGKKHNETVKIDLWKIVKLSGESLLDVKIILEYMDDDMYISIGKLTQGIQEVKVTNRGADYFKNFK